MDNNDNEDGNFLYCPVMTSLDEHRLDPEVLLQRLKDEEAKAKRGKLTIFFGMCAGVGKTYDMLKSAHEARTKGINVVIGVAEAHGRRETEVLLDGLPVIPSRTIEYKGSVLKEMDLDAILEHKPSLVLVDELAHNNAPGSRHAKRYQDVQELLDNEIDVFTTLNVQHLESRADTVAQITGIVVRETVPDSVLENADEVVLVDLSPDELLKRFAEGKVYTGDRSQHAIENFFRKGNITALREMSLRLTAERVDHQLRDYMRSRQIQGPWKTGQRLIMGISPSPHNAALIRWARRMAYTQDAPWIAVYVEASRPLSESGAQGLAQNIKLARELGAEVVTTADDDVAGALIRVAREQNASQILVGKHRRSFALRKSLLERIIEQSGDLDIYVLGADQEPSHGWRLRLPAFSSTMQHYLACAAIVLAVALLTYPARAILSYQTVSLVLLLTVALLPLRFGAGPVLLAAAISALVWDFFFIPPQFTFAIGTGQDLLMVIIYFAISAVTGTLTVRIRARERAVRQREERTSALYTLTRDLSNARNQDDVAAATVSHIERFFGATVALFLSDTDGDIFTRAHAASNFEPDGKEFSVASWVHWNERKAGRFTDTLPSAQATYYPISGPRYSLGVVGVRPRDPRPLNIDQEALLENFIRQVASALEREQLNEIAKRSILVSESERLYKTLFNSISHELRTPLAAILTATEALNDARARDDLSRPHLVGEIRTAAERLNRLVENLLDMTRLETGRIAPAADWCSAEDLVNASLHKLARDLRHHSVTMAIAPGIPLVKADFGLIEQAITNILHNAAEYTPPGTAIRIEAFSHDQSLTIRVTDNGPGFPPVDLPRVTEKFYRVSGTKAGGTGLGLSIARGFVEAHRGRLIVGNQPGGGASITMMLPLEQYQHEEPVAPHDAA